MCMSGYLGAWGEQLDKIRDMSSERGESREERGGDVKFNL